MQAKVIARPRNLPCRNATPAHLRRGYVRQSQNHPTPVSRRVIISRRQRQRNPLPRQRLTERAVHIMNQNGLLQTYVRPQADVFATANTAELRVKICGEICDRLKWRAARKTSLKLWLPKSTFANLIFGKINEDQFKWTITKPKAKRGITKPGTTTMRVAISSHQFVEIFGLGSDVKHTTDENKLMFITKIFNSENDVVRISYCLDTSTLRLRFTYKIFQLDVDPMTGIIEYLEM
eukprot:TRINITY_DN6095_c0_g1_i2.p1 TRINITY_DN6095_c0_g1~~TRINITY_DN6095_c0_g1_i2.p1  ORF type:complete len:244 (-),score=2.37 TRINITY_DN6095_c0_g1_i2:25-729(-)